MEFKVLPVDATPPQAGRSTIYLKKDNWNDYSYVTMFDMSLHDAYGNFSTIGGIKIAFKGQSTSVSTFSTLDKSFTELDEKYFSLGDSASFYKCMAELDRDTRKTILAALRDVVFQPQIIDEITNEDVFSTSLLRHHSLSVVKGQFARILWNKAELTEYAFQYTRPEGSELGSITMSFDVSVNVEPGTNVHAIIGRNGVGKTTLLNGMIESVTNKNRRNFFLNKAGEPIDSDYFSSLVSVSFSAFDPFAPPADQPDPAKGTCYFYVGLKKTGTSDDLKTSQELRQDCIKALVACFGVPGKVERWLQAIEKLGSDENFSRMDLQQLESVYRAIKQELSGVSQEDSRQFYESYYHKALPYLAKMSSGHSIVLLTITRLVALVEEKTLVLLDEPESHLHPPLLSAFVRALADLLHNRNGVAIIATHSPVVLQEIPRSCAWIINRVGKVSFTIRPKIETFGENVGVLTSEVFNLEVERSGFHDLLAASVRTGKSYENIVSDYNGQLGLEGRALLRSLVETRDQESGYDAS
ncbi:AAA family ATPase [Pseudomonas viridiflava]|uniref:AAA family ATPase n=1 Tax=Pseudomonas viridiflava TaxID=33069 RepID=UPI002EC30BDD|nr:AAA family ATPase [Pseudomonas viridiflava]